MSPGLSASVIAEFTCTTNRVIRECYREIYLCHQGYLRVLSQNLPVPPIGLFASVIAKFTYVTRVICECYRRIYLYHHKVYCECYRKIYLCHQGYLRVLSQNLPVPPIGLSASVIAKFTYVIRVICECYRRIYLYHQ